MTRLRLVGVPLAIGLRRMRERPLTTAVAVLAAAGAAALIGWSSLASALAQENDVRLRLGEVSSGVRSIQGVAFVVPLEPAELHTRSIDSFLDRFRDVTGARATVRISSPIAPANEFGTRLVTASRPGRDVSVSDGRLPRGCEQEVCEALGLAGGFHVGQRVRLGRVVVRIVGRGSVRRDVLPRRVQPFAGDDKTLLVGSFAGPLAGLLRTSGSVVVETAPLDPRKVHGADVRALQERLRVEIVRLTRADSSLDASAPLRLLDDIAHRGEIARDRLLLVAAQGAALIVAFAAFAAALRRRETRLLDDQLSVLGASRPQAFAARAIEAVLTSAVGLGIALGGLRLAVELVQRHRGLPDGFVGAALPAKTVLVIVGVTAVGVPLTLASARGGGRRRFGIGGVEIAALTALGVVVWQATTTGALDPDQLARGGAGPVLLLVPGLAFFAAGVLLVRVLPAALRLAERVTRGAPFGLRLAFLTAARNPGEGAAATTFLAVALGSALFSLGYAATLDRQARDEASFTAGARWRVLERSGSATFAPPDVTPLTRYAVASTEKPAPVIRLDAQLEDASAPAGGGRPVEIIGVPAARVTGLLGWRHDFSSLSRSEVAQRLRPHPLALRGPPLAGDASAIRVWAFGQTQFPRKVVAHFLLPKEQRFGFVQLGFVWKKWTRLRAPIPATLRGAELVGIELLPSNVPVGRALDLNGFVELGRVEQRQRGGWSTLVSLDGWSAARPPEAAIESQNPASGFVEKADTEAGSPIRVATQFWLSDTRTPLLRPTLPLPDAIPAVVSGPVARTAVQAAVTAGPTVRITSRPSDPTTSDRARLAFESEPGATFVCSLDNGLPGQCRSPVTYGGLRSGLHTFWVMATDSSGNSGPGVVIGWTISPQVETAPARPMPPITVPADAIRITSGPPATTTKHTARIEFVAPEGVTNLHCFVTRGHSNSPDPCQSPVVYKGLGAGDHQFVVSGVDRTGNSVSGHVRWEIVRHATRTHAAATTVAPPPPPPATTTDTRTSGCSGIVTLSFEGRLLPVRVVGCASRFPSVVQPRSSFVAVDYDTLFAALNADRPGAQLPNEAWFFDRQQPGFVARLEHRPFRLVRTVSADALRQRFLEDPLASGTRNVLLVSTLSAALLAVLGLALAVRSTLTAERTLLGEYEALGLPPRALARATQVRLLAISFLGIGAALLGSILALRLIGALVAVTGTSARPLLDIEAVVAWKSGAATLGAVSLAAVAIVAVLAGRALREPAARRLRA